MSQYEINMNEYGVDECIVQNHQKKITVSFSECYRRKYWDKAITVKDYMAFRRRYLEDAFEDYSFNITEYDDDNEDDYEIFVYEITLKTDSRPDVLIIPKYREFNEKLKLFLETLPDAIMKCMEKVLES